MSNPTSTSSVSFGKKLVRFFVRLLVTSVILSLTALVVYLFSERNAQTFTLHVVDDTLIIHKGKFLPLGSNPWLSENEAYAPLALEGFTPEFIENAKYRDTRELDRALFSVLEALAKPRILSEDSARQTRGIYYLRRAELLKDLTLEQQNTLKTLRAEVAFATARARLSEVELLVRDIVEQFKLATQTPNKSTQTAARILLLLEPVFNQLNLAIQHALSSSLPELREENPPSPAPPPFAE